MTIWEEYQLWRENLHDTRKTGREQDALKAMEMSKYFIGRVKAAKEAAKPEAKKKETKK